MKKIYASEFVTRTTAPTSDDARFTRISYGGWSPCIDGSPQSWAGSVLSNCVGYAFGRFAEIGDMTADECKLGKVAGVSYPQSASVWWNQRAAMGYESGQTPKLGACGCWLLEGGTVGHVRIVEAINADGSVLFSESAWGGSTFSTKLMSGDLSYYGYYGKMKFQGFIYNPAVIENPYPVPVERDETKHQYIVNVDNIRLRVGPGKSYKCVGNITPGIYNVLEQQEADGYTWNKVSEGYWSAFCIGDCEDLPVTDPKDKEIKELKAKVKELTEENELINKENTQLKAKIDKAKKDLE